MKKFNNVSEYHAAVENGELPYTRCAVALGKFDGIHLGHQKLLKKVKETAAGKMNSVIFVIDVNQNGILSHEERADFLESLGMDVLIECPFSREFMHLTHQQFLESVLVRSLKASCIVVGVDFHFGRDRLGDSSYFLEEQEKYNYTAYILEKETYEGEDISSSRIREALSRGDMELTEQLLGRPYRVSGEVIHGNHIGTGLGFPTANILPASDKIFPPRGVYLSITELPDGRRVPGISNYGCKPTIGKYVPGLETCLFDFNEDIYGQMIRVDLIKYIRAERHFASVNELLEQMHIDYSKARELLANHTDL